MYVEERIWQYLAVTLTAAADAARVQSPTWVLAACVRCLAVLPHARMPTQPHQPDCW